MTLTYFVVVVYFKKICELFFSWVSFKGRVGGGGVRWGEEKNFRTRSSRTQTDE